MIKNTLLLLLFVSTGLSAQNTFPPTGNVTIGSNFGASISGTTGGNAVFGTNLALRQGGTNHNKLYTPFAHSNNYGFAGIRTSWSKILFYTQKSNTTADQFVNPPIRMAINELGNVGIGTANPLAKLQLSANNTVFSIRPESNASGTLLTSGQQLHLVFDDNNAGTDYFTIRSNGTKIANSTEHLRVTSEGKIGIGTTAPKAKLHVEGPAKVGKWGTLTLDWTNETNWGGNSNRWSGYIGFNSYRNDEDAKDYYYGSNRYTSKGVLEGSNYGFRWLFRNRNNNDSDGQHKLTEYMRLTNTGNLGIGTNTPDAKLAVNGKIHAKEVKVDLAGWPDYVFENEYKLPSLSQVENHIKEKGHLQNIPSAKEVEKNGIELGEMNKKLLEKIEELTLYTIEQEKKITDQEKIIKKLQLENDRQTLIDAQLQTINKNLENRLLKLESFFKHKKTTQQRLKKQ